MTPYQLVSGVLTPSVADKRTMVLRSRELEQAALQDPPRVAAVALQDARYLTRRTRAVYDALAAAGTDVTVYGRDVQSWLAPGVSGVSLTDEDALVDEWILVLPSPGGPVCLVATDLHTAPADQVDRRFSYIVTSDAELVEECLRLLPKATAAT